MTRILPKQAILVIAVTAGIMTAGSAGAQSAEISCTSISPHDRVYCPLPADVARVSLSRQVSEQPCIFGKSWGLRGSMIWTDGGCAATFTIQLEQPRGRGAMPDNTDKGGPETDRETGRSRREA